jgi:hypothetical protein
MQPREFKNPFQQSVRKYIKETTSLASLVCCISSVQPPNFIHTAIMRLPTSVVLVLATLAAAHPGEDHRDELQKRRSFEAGAERLSLRHCAEKLKARGVTDRNIKRRAAVIERHRQKRKN